MRLVSFLLPALLLAAPLAQAQKPAQKPARKPAAPLTQPTQQPAAAAPANAKTLLWEISGNQLAQPSYVFGTMHLVCAADLKLSPAVEQALSQSQQVALEIDMDDPQLAQQMQAGMMLPAGQTVQDCLSAGDYQLVSDYFTNELKMPFAQMGTIKPFVLMSLLYPGLLGCPVGSYEMKLVEAAKTRQQEVIGLETVAEQFGVFEKIPCAKQAQWLTETLTKRPQQVSELQSLLRLYQAQDVDGLLAMSMSSQMGMAEYEALLLTDRNRRWIPLMAQQAARKPTFFAVGAAHLGGPAGVLALLRQQGYHVKPVL